MSSISFPHTIYSPKISPQKSKVQPLSPCNKVTTAADKIHKEYSSKRILTIHNQSPKENAPPNQINALASKTILSKSTSIIKNESCNPNFNNRSNKLYNNSIIECIEESKLDKAKKLLKDATIPSKKIYLILINKYIDLKDHQTADSLIQEMKDRRMPCDVSIYGLRIRSAFLGNDFERGLKIFDEMVEAEISPNIKIYMPIIKECFKRNDPQLAMNYLGHMITKSRIHPDEHIYSLVIKYLCKNNKKLTEVNKVLQAMEAKNISKSHIFYGSLIYSLAIDANEPELGVSYYKEMKKQNIQPSDKTSASMLDALMKIDIEKAKKFFRKNNLKICYMNGELDCHNLSRGWSFVQILIHLENYPGSKFKVITGKGLHSDSNTLYEMRDYILANAALFIKNYKITSCKDNTGCLKFEPIPTFTKASENESKEHFWGTLKQKMDPCANPAIRIPQMDQEENSEPLITDQLPSMRKVTSRNIISSLENDSIYETFQLVDEMKKQGTEMDVGLYNKLTLASFRKGLVFKGICLFQEMIQKNIVPSRKTYYVLIKMHLQRSEFELAEKLFYEMKIDPNAKIYNLFLNAYTNAGNFQAVSETYAEMLNKGVQPTSETIRLISIPYLQGYETNYYLPLSL